MSLDIVYKKDLFEKRYDNFAPHKFFIESLYEYNTHKVDLFWMSYPETDLYILIGFREKDEKWQEGAPLHKGTNIATPYYEPINWHPLSEKELFTIFLQNNKIRMRVEKTHRSENAPWYAPANVLPKITYDNLCQNVPHSEWRFHSS